MLGLFPKGPCRRRVRREGSGGSGGGKAMFKIALTPLLAPRQTRMYQLRCQSGLGTPRRGRSSRRARRSWRRAHGRRLAPGHPPWPPRAEATPVRPATQTHRRGRRGPPSPAPLRAQRELGSPESHLLLADYYVPFRAGTRHQVSRARTSLSLGVRAATCHCPGEGWEAPRRPEKTGVWRLCALPLPAPMFPPVAASEGTTFEA